MYTIIDLETTGFSPNRGHKIIEVAAIKLDHSINIVDQYSTLINPQRDISNSDIHGITATHVKNAPTLSEVKGFLKFFLNDTILIAHNAPFDKRFIESEVLDKKNEITALCTIQLSRMVENSIPSRNLTALCNFYDIEYPSEHEALSDALATTRLFKKLRREFIKCYGNDDFEKVFSVNSTKIQDVSENTKRLKFTRHDASIDSKRKKTKIRQFLDRVPIESITEKNTSKVYLDLLHKILSDRLITDDEIAELEEVVKDLDLAKEEIVELHNHYLIELINVYLIDNIISDFELEDLLNVSKLLGFDKEQLDTLIEESEKENNPAFQNSHDVDISEKSICFTGKFKAKVDGIPVDRSTLQKIAQQHGMIIKKNVTKKLDYLAVADPNSMSTKAKKARKYGLKVLAEPEFWRLVNINIE